MRLVLLQLGYSPLCALRIEGKGRITHFFANIEENLFCQRMQITDIIVCSNSMISPLFVLSVDPSLGRLDYSLLSDQALMEMLIKGFGDDIKEKYQDDHGMYLDVCRWSGIECDEDGRVAKILIDTCRTNGFIEICYVPPKVEFFLVDSWFGSKLTGSVDLTQLPDGMKFFLLNNHNMTGEIDLTQHPDGMKELHLSENQLTGEIDLTRLPGGMEILALDKNKLTGGIDLTKLPDEMQRLLLYNNELTGEVDVTQLPHTMEWLFLEHNRLTGEIDLTQLPEGMEDLHLSNNQFTGKIDLTQLPGGMNDLDLENNNLTGSLIIKKLPRRMKIIDARGNHFNAIAEVDSRTDAAISLEGSGVTSVVDEKGREEDMGQFLK